MKKTYKTLFAAVLAFFCARPLIAEITVNDTLTHEFSIGPGEEYSGSIVIHNGGGEQEEVKIYQTDFRTEAGGVSYYPDPDTTPRSNAGWTEFTPERFFIPAGEDYTVQFMMRMPDDDTLAGTYWSMLMVEAVPKSSPESSEFVPNEINIGIQTILRYAIRIISHIGRTGSVQPEILAANLGSEEGTVFLAMDIANGGTRLFRLDFWSELYTLDGEYYGKYTGQKLAVFPGSSIRFRVDFPDVAKGEYLALVVLDCGNDNVYGVNYNIVIE